VKASVERATRRGKALRIVKSTSFDEEVVEAVLAETRGFGLSVSATGSVRGSFFLLARGRKRRREGAPSEGSLDRGCQPGAAGARTLVRRRRACGRTRRSWRRYVNERSHSRGPVGLWLQRTCRRGVNNVFLHLESRTGRAGARVVMAVAEVGETHLLRFSGRVSREANQDRGGVA